MIDLAHGACDILLAAEPADKVARALALAADWKRQQAAFVSPGNPPARPARPERPPLLRPRDMPKRKAGGSQEKRVALLHALAHIELNAIDLAWDIIARFGTADTPRASRTSGTTARRASRSCAVSSAACHRPSWAGRSP